MCYENPLHLAEEIAALDLLLDQRIAIGISRSSPEQARRGWEAFGYTSTEGPRGSDFQDQIGMIDGFTSTFGKTYADEPDKLIEQLKADPAIQAADTLMLTIPNQLGAEYNLHILQSFAEHVAPALGWKPNTEGPATGYAID